MDQGRKRWLIRLAVVLVVGLAGLWWTVAERTRNLVVENHSGQKVAFLEVTLAGQTHTFRDVATGAQRTAPCEAKDGDRFRVEGKLADETRIRANGMIGESLHFLVLPGGEVKFRSKGPSRGSSLQSLFPIGNFTP